MHVSPRWKRALSILLPAAMLFFAGYKMWQHSAQLKQFHWTLSPGLLALSFVALFTAFFLVVFVWTLLLRRMGYTLRYRRAFEIWYITNLGRYLPGKVWTVVGMVYYCEKEGLPKSTVLASGVITQLFSIATAFMLGTAYIGSAKIGSSAGSLGVWLPSLLIGLGVLLLPLMFPDFCIGCLAWVLRKLGRKEIPRGLHVPNRVLFFGLNILCWLVYGTAFGLFVLSISPVPRMELVTLIPTFALSYTLGFIAVFAPSGFGVREGVMVLLLSAMFPVTVAVAIAVAARIWFTAGELLFFVVAWYLQAGGYAQIFPALRRACRLLVPMGSER